MAKRSTLIALGCFALFVGFSVGMIPITVIAGLCGAVLYAPTYFFTKRQEDLRAVNTLVFRRKKAWFLLMAAIVLFSLIIYGTSMPLWTLFSSFFRIGMLAFGGGIAAIPLIEASFVRALHWFTPMQFWDGIAISQITPGPIFIVAAFFGYKIYGILGAAVATIGMCIPSVLLMIMVGKVHALIKHLTIVQGITKGLLSGFIGVLAALIIQQIERIVPSWETAILIGVSFIIIRSVKRGAFLAAVLCIVFSFFLPAH
jgi:chromate transporter